MSKGPIRMSRLTDAQCTALKSTLGCCEDDVREMALSIERIFGVGLTHWKIVLPIRFSEGLSGYVVTRLKYNNISFSSFTPSDKVYLVNRTGLLLTNGDRKSVKTKKS